jgi:hypothetical protein
MQPPPGGRRNEADACWKMLSQSYYSKGISQEHKEFPSVGFPTTDRPPMSATFSISRSLAKGLAQDDRVLSFRPDSSVCEAIERMAEQGLGALLSVRKKYRIGILSQPDYACKVILNGHLPPPEADSGPRDDDIPSDICDSTEYSARMHLGELRLLGAQMFSQWQLILRVRWPLCRGVRREFFRRGVDGCLDSAITRQVYNG